MQLTKGAIGNLINRYKAVLKKCHLMNTFGSLAVAGMLVMGGAAAAGAADAPDVALEGEKTYDSTETPEVNHLMGGWLVNDAETAGKAQGDITLTVEGGSISEIIGGSYAKNVNGNNVTVTHGDITTISDKTTSAEFVVGGSKVAGGDGANLETGKTTLIINSGTFGKEDKTKAYELVMGGNYAKTAGSSKLTAATDGSSVTVNDGTFHASVVGGSVAHNYSENGSITVTDNGNTSVTITGGTFNPSQSSLADEQGGINLSAAVIGGGLAYGANTNSVLGSRDNPVISSVTINDGTINGKIVAGSAAMNGSTAMIHGNSQLTVSGGTLNNDLIGGGFAENAYLPQEGYSLNITGDTGVSMSGGTLDGEVIGGSYIRATGTGKVANSSVAISGGRQAAQDNKKAQYVIGGNKAMAYSGSTTTVVVEETSSVSISGKDTLVADGAVLGGGLAKATDTGKATSTVNNSLVSVKDGTLAGVIGGGMAETYSIKEGGFAKSEVTGASSVAISGGTINQIQFGAVDANDGALDAAIVGGGMANDANSTATVGSTNVTISAGTILGKVVAGGAAANGGTTTVKGDTFLSMTGGTVKDDLVGGNLVDGSASTNTTFAQASDVKGSTHVSLTGGNIDGEIVGGSYVRNANATANVEGDTYVTVSAKSGNDTPQAWVQYVIGGGKAMAVSGQTATTNVDGSTHVLVEGGAAINFGTVAGGGLARSQGGTTTANVSNSNVEINGGTLAGVAGGGIAESYGGNATANVGISSMPNVATLVINEGTINKIKYGDTTSTAAVVGGGIAWVKNGVTGSATANISDLDSTGIDDGIVNTVITGGNINGDVYAGGIADGANATANVTTANLTIKGGTINGNVYAGGYALNGGKADVTTAIITLDGTGAKVNGDFEGNTTSTLAFNNYNGTFDNAAYGFGTLNVAEGSNVRMGAVVSGKQGADTEDPETGFFGARPNAEGSSNPITITGGGTITAKQFHVSTNANVTIAHGNVVADDVQVQSATLKVGGESTSASLTVNENLIIDKTYQANQNIDVENLGTLTLGKNIVLDENGELKTAYLDTVPSHVKAGGTLKINGLDGKTLTDTELASLQGLLDSNIQGTPPGEGLLDLGGADLGEAVRPNDDGTVSYDKVAGITTDSLKDKTVQVTKDQNEKGISGGFKAVQLAEGSELNAKGTLVLAGSQNGDNLVIDTKGAVADLRVGGSLSDRDTSAVTLGLADANNSGTVRTVTLNADTGNKATLNVIGAGAAEFTVGDIRANESTNTINVAGATLNTGNITTEAVSPATLDAMNITNGTVKAAGDAEIKNVTLDNGLLQAVATTGETPAGGDITIDGNLSGQGSVVAANTLTLTTTYTGKEGDDLTLQAETLKTAAISSTDGDLVIAATNLVTTDATTLVDDTLVADNVALGGALTASGASLVQVGGFYTSDDFTTEGLNKAVSVTGQSLMAYGADLAQAQQAVAETGHTGAAYYAGKELKLVGDGGLTVGDTAGGPGAVTFGSGSLLVVDGTAMNGNTVFTGAEASHDLTASVDASSSKLHVDNAVAGGFTVFGEGFTELASGWTDDNVTTDSAMLDASYRDNEVTVKTNNAHTVFPNLSDGMADAVNDLYNGKLNNVDSTDMGVRFLSRATNDHFLGADKDAAAATIESAARIAFAGAVPQMTKMASDAGTNAVVNRLGFANPADGAQAMNAEGKIVDRNTTGFALWIAPLWQSQHGWGMEADNLDYGFNGNLGGVSLGADYTFENAIRAGITFNIGGGYAESSGGDLNSTENRMSFWGLGAYAGWNYENFGLMADVSYTSTWNDLKQDMDSRMGMGDLEADVQASAISAGLRAEYKLETSVLDVIPHIGVRYMSLNTWGFDAESNGGTVLEGDGFHQDIWTFPVGVTFTKDFTLDSGWSFKPSIDFSVIPAAGDIKAKQDVAFTGLPGTYEVETQMMDYLTWQGGVGLEMGNDTMSFGVNYTLQAGQHTTGHGVFGSFRYEF